MINWSESMEQTFEYYVVDPHTWADLRPIETVKACTVNRDSDTETLGSATFDIDESIGECYIRAYLIASQNGVREKIALGTFLVQTPSKSFDGKSSSISLDAYTPLLELKEGMPPIGYYIAKGMNVMDTAYMLVRENARAPVIKPKCDTNLYYDFVSDTSDSWLTFITDLILDVNYKFVLDELGRILFAPKQDAASLRPIWTYTDDNSSILYPEITTKHDLYGIPNVVEVLYTNGSGNDYGCAKNEDIDRPTSIQKRGRTITYRTIDPNIGGNPTEGQVQEYAERLLKELSSIEYTVTYTHGYCPVRLGDCVRLNSSKYGFDNVKARVISQTIKCEPGCPVTEKAVFTASLWR